MPSYIPVIKGLNNHAVSKQMMPQTSLFQARTITRAKVDKNMTWPEFKIFGAVISQVSKKDKGFVDVTTTIGALCKLANLGGEKDPGRYQRVRALLTVLTTRGVVISKETEEGKEKIYAQLFAEARHREETGLITFRLHPRMKEHFLQLHNYTLVKHLPEFLELGSVAQGRLYMLACDCQNLRSSSLRTFTVLELLEILGMPTVRHEENWRTVEKIFRVYKGLRKKNISLKFKLIKIKKDKKAMICLEFPGKETSLSSTNTDFV